MKRIEIMLSQAVDDDFLLLLSENKVGNAFTKITNIFGKGESIAKMGDEVWPQMNNMYILYASDDETEKIIELVKNLRNAYPKEGIGCFTTDAEIR